jgi:hypothetical protein
MIFRHACAAALAVFLFCSAAAAQRADVTISLNEAFFDALLDSVYQNFEPPQFPIAQKSDDGPGRIESSQNEIKSNRNIALLPVSYLSGNSLVGSPRIVAEQPFCEQNVKILREMNGVRTAVKFREGRIYVPLAFSGSYEPPFIGCVDFDGWAEANIDLEFDQAGQRLIGRVRVQNVNLNGTGGIGGTVIAKLIQGSIDKKMNPIEILRVDKLSFLVPIQNSGTLRMKAVGVRHEIQIGSLNIVISFEFVKG